MNDQKLNQLILASTRLHSAISLDELLDIAAEEARSLLAADAVVLTLADPAGEYDVKSMSPRDAAPGETAPSLVVPLLDRGKQEFGSIAIYADPAHPLNEIAGGLARQFAVTAAIAIENRQLFEVSDAADARFKRFVEIAREGIWMIGPDERIRYVNMHMAKMLGHGPDEVIGRSVFDFMAPEEREISTRVKEAGEIGKSGQREAKLIHKDGTHIWTLASTVPVFRSDGSFEGALGVVMDITARKHAEDELRDNQAALETALDINSGIIESALDVVCVMDANSKFVSVSKRARDVWGYEPEEMLGKAFREFMPAERIERAALMTADIKAGRVAAQPTETQFRRKDGVFIPMLISVSWNVRHNLMFAFMRDLSEQKEMEARLRQSQRLEAIGQLTGGVAHDFNNLLTVILGNAEALADRLNDDQRSRVLAEMTRTAAERGADLTNRLLAFARRQPLEPQTCDVNKLVARMDGLIRRMLDEDIEIEVVRGAGLWTAMVDPSQLEAAILNLSVNARDAMPDGGRLTIETANAHIDSSYADQHVEVAAGQYVMLSVSDNGMGMPPEVASRAFEPFFTTKAVGKGSGLGLSMVYGFVKQSGGHVKIYSETGQGTNVKIYLPRGETEAPDAPDRKRDAEDQRGNELILLVEDNDLVRSYVDGQLKSLGYRVISVDNGPEALEVVRSGEEIDLLFTDVVMPGGLNGRQLAEEARKLKPGLKVLFTSGYTENAIVHHGRLDRGVHLLSKPYRRSELAAKVRLVLSATEEN
ncbi:MAG: PAS domain S-box protein [Parvibaculum sp.]|uniref:PAS domain S-box protein n=1 Tax=Parvibaculum sp. TaxID=2024848 RepID=UPI0025E9EB5D|nr:PAS domain S-box protein [Parvibaculum sp.]MCE9649814.1 PAS domain S-box protein [Parvibaculum sp.]